MIEMEAANFIVREIWSVECPHCSEEMDAPFNKDNPMSPMVVECETCGEQFKLTYERD